LAGCCECGDEPSGSGATELVTALSGSVRFHDYMGRLRVADRRNGLQIWRVTVNSLNKYSLTTDRVWPFSLEVGCGPNNSHL
jgi:hypothetical protein